MNDCPQTFEETCILDPKPATLWVKQSTPNWQMMGRDRKGDRTTVRGKCCLARLASILFVCTAAAISTGYGQMDPDSRQLLQLGFNQSLHDDGPTAAYAFYYWNQPDVPATNMTLRLVIAPVYLDGELGFKGLLGENTDLGVGVFGGGFYNSYQEVRQGKNSVAFLLQYNFGKLTSASDRAFETLQNAPRLPFRFTQ